MQIQQSLSQIQIILDQRLSFRIILAVSVFFLGWALSCWLAKKISRILEKTSLDKIAKSIQLDGIPGGSLHGFIGEILKYSFLLIALMVATDIAGLQQVSGFLVSIIKFLPNIYISLAILFIALFAESFCRKIIVGSVEGEKFVYSKILGETARISIRILAILAVLYQLKIAQALALSVFIALLATLALAVGISFGMGGKDIAKKFLDEVKKKIS